MKKTTKRTTQRNKKTEPKKVRYAVIGLGHIAQAAVLPAFRHASENSELTALVSGDPAKLRRLGRQYGVPYKVGFRQLDDFLESGKVDAVYIATPNSTHRAIAERAARLGVHVLCEKPMATTESDCRAMIEAARDGRARLMIAYRLHFEAANLEAIRLAESGKIGEIKTFASTFSINVRDRYNIRLQRNKGGGTLYDIGVYCINAARYLFKSEPEEVFAFT
jgi:predicted dehydrogenase